jgi:hypothetical protein
MALTSLTAFVVRPHPSAVPDISIGALDAMDAIANVVLLGPAAHHHK